jgi:hypothetical protein
MIRNEQSPKCHSEQSEESFAMSEVTGDLNTHCCLFLELEHLAELGPELQPLPLMK